MFAITKLTLRGGRIAWVCFTQIAWIEELPEGSIPGERSLIYFTGGGEGIYVMESPQEILKRISSMAQPQRQSGLVVPAGVVR